MKEVYLVRHGETVTNVLKQFSGVYDCDLSEKGLKQVEQLKEKFKDIKIDKIYSSPLKRAYMTAQAVGDNIETVDDLKEMNFGIFEGKTFEEVFNNYESDVHKALGEDFDYTYPEGDNKVEFWKRINRAFEKIIQEDENDVIAIVSHSCVTRAILTKILSGSYYGFWSFNLDNCSVSKLLVYDKTGFIVDYINKDAIGGDNI